MKLVFTIHCTRISANICKFVCVCVYEDRERLLGVEKTVHKVGGGYDVVSFNDSLLSSPPSSGMGVG